MEISDIKRVIIVGGGDMGHGIAEACAIAGYDVALNGIRQVSLDRAMERIRESLTILSRKKKVPSNDVDLILGRIETSVDLQEAIQGAQLAIEAVPEIINLKKFVLQDLDAYLPPESIIATNTSNMSITELANNTSRPDCVAGLHFFNPVILMKSVEIVRGEQCSDTTVQTLFKFAESLRKIPIIVKKDSAGFVVNRILVAGQVLAGRAVEQGSATPSQIDGIAHKVGLSMGPFETMDYVGLDVVVNGMDYFADHFGNDYAAPTWIKDLVVIGNLGKKTGSGILDWSNGQPIINVSEATDKLSLLDFIAVQVNEATKLLEEGVIDNLEEIDSAIKNGTLNIAGIMGILKSLGKEKVCDICDRLANEFNLEIFRPTKVLREWD